MTLSCYVTNPRKGEGKAKGREGAGKGRGRVNGGMTAFFLLVLIKYLLDTGKRSCRDGSCCRCCLGGNGEY